MLLGVFEQTTYVMAYGETGRYPLYINSYTKYLKYWFQVLHLRQSDTSKQAYWKLSNLDEQRTCKLGIQN